MSCGFWLCWEKYMSYIQNQTGIKLLSKTKRTINTNKMSHIVSSSDLGLISKKRNHIERLNSNIRRFRGLMIKYTKNIDSYLTYLYVVLIYVACYNIIKLCVY